jgi:hypothetical protein
MCGQAFVGVSKHHFSIRRQAVYMKLVFTQIALPQMRQERYPGLSGDGELAQITLAKPKRAFAWNGAASSNSGGLTRRTVQ